MVQHVSFSSLGGAGAVAVRLVALQRRLGVEADLVTLVDTPFPRWAGRHPLVAAAALIDYYLVRKRRSSAFFTLFRHQHQSGLCRDFLRHDGVLHLHLLPGIVWPPALFSALPRAKVVVWSIQDLWPLTGGCHYTNGCTGFMRDCHGCPQARGPFRRSVATALRRKRDAYATVPGGVAAVPSDWTRTQLAASTALAGWPVAVIPNPVDTTSFSVGDCETLRRKWGIPPAVPVIGLGAVNLRDERKQIFETLAALTQWNAERAAAARAQIIVFGGSVPTRKTPPDVRFLGPSPDAATLAEWYNVMDVYVSMSRFETFGNTLAEAAACGTPSICATGSGMADVVVPEKTGLHVTALDTLPAALSVLDAPGRLSELGAEARRHACAVFDSEVVARRFLDLYDEPVYRNPAHHGSDA